MEIVGLLAIGLVSLVALVASTTWENFAIPKLIGGAFALALVINGGNEVFKRLNLPLPSPSQIEPMLWAGSGLVVILSIILWKFDDVWELLRKAGVAE